MTEKCPDCGADVKYYHNPSYTEIVCSKKCKGFHTIRTSERKKVLNFMGEKYNLTGKK